MNGLRDDLASMMNDPSIPQNVNNRMLLAVLSEIYTTISSMKADQEEHQRSIDAKLEQIDEKVSTNIEAMKAENAALKQRIAELEKNPSIVWLLRYRPRQTVAAILMIFIFITFLVANMPDTVWIWLGLPPP